MRSSLLLVMSALISQTAVAATRYVPTNHATIQSAIVAADDGDEIVVFAGTYLEAIEFLGKAITLRSASGPEVTIIDGTGHASSVVIFQDDETETTVIDGFTITGGTGNSEGGKTRGGGLYLRYSHPIVRNCIVTGNTADSGGGLDTIGSIGLVIDCVFVENTSTAGGFFGGAGMHMNASNLKVRNCLFVRNHAIAASNGGGVSVFLGAPEITNCLFFENDAMTGGGLMNQRGQPRITNCTFVANQAVNAGGGMRSLYENGQAVVTNSIFWDNLSENGASEIVDDFGAVTNVRFCDVKGGWLGAGDGNMAQLPRFIDCTAGGCRPGPDSPCIDASDNDAVPDAVTVDLDGHERIVNSTVDMGAYEYQSTCSSDISGDGWVSLSDLVAVLANWGVCSGCPADVDGSGAVDFIDLVSVLSDWGLCE